MNTTQRTNIDREDWISRFYGYLGAFRYLRRKQAVSFLEKAEKKEPFKAVYDTYGDSCKSDNIVFIYGSPKGGKTEYTQMLISELNQPGSIYQGVRMEFDEWESAIGVRRMQEKFIEIFEDAPFGFTFPCVDFAENASEYSKTVPKPVFEFIQTVYDITTGSIGAVTELKEKWGAVKKIIDFKSPKQKDTKDNLQILMEEYEAYGRNMKRSKAEPFLWYKMDMFANVRNHNKQIICVIDNFHLFSKQLPELSEQYEFMELLSALSDVVWVLVGEKKPSKLVKQYVKKENCWRMAGLDRERCVKHLKKCCPGKERMLRYAERDAWYDWVYEKTGGYIGLLQLCIEMETKEDGSYGFLEFARWMDGNQERLTPEERALVNSPQKYEELLLMKWFEYVWNGEDDNNGPSPIEFLMKDEFRQVRLADEDEVDLMKQYAVPCLCYMIHLSDNSNKGTVKQLFWKSDGTGEGVPLNDIGRRILRVLTANIPFVLEYVEYPGTFYLDTVIMDVMMHHRQYEAWRDMFRIYEEHSKVMGEVDSKTVNSAEKLNTAPEKVGAEDVAEVGKGAINVIGWFTRQVDEKEDTISKQQKEIETLRREMQDLKAKRSSKDEPTPAQLLPDTDFKEIGGSGNTRERVSEQTEGAETDKQEEQKPVSDIPTDNEVPDDVNSKDDNNKK